MVKGATTRTRQKVALIINTLLRGRAPLQKEDDEAGRRTKKVKKAEKHKVRVRHFEPTKLGQGGA